MSYIVEAGVDAEAVLTAAFDTWEDVQEARALGTGGLLRKYGPKVAGAIAGFTAAEIGRRISGKWGNTQASAMPLYKTRRVLSAKRGGSRYRRPVRRIAKKKKSVTSADISRVPRGLPVTFGNKYTCALRFSAIVTLTPAGVNTHATETFVANWLGQPQPTQVGHQPRGYDQLFALFNKAVVTSSAIKCSSMAQSSTAATANAVYFLNRSTSSTMPGARHDRIGEWTNTKTAVGGQADGGGAKAVLKDTWTPGKYGQTAKSDALASYAGAVPSSPFYFHVGVTNLQTGQTGAQVHVFVEMLFKVVWSDRKDLVAS